MEMISNYSAHPNSGNGANEVSLPQDNYFWMRIEDFATQIRICSLKARCGTTSAKSYQKILDISKKIQTEVYNHFNQTSKANPNFPHVNLSAFSDSTPKDPHDSMKNNNGLENSIKFSLELPPQNTNTPYITPPSFPPSFNNAPYFIPNNGNPPPLSSAPPLPNSLLPNSINSITNSNLPPPSNNTLGNSQNPNITVIQHDLENGNNIVIDASKDDKYSFTSQLFDKNLNSQKRQKRKRKNKEMDRVCSMCETSDTPEWRRGPLGPRTLCNACGLKWSKKVKTEGNQKPDFSNLELTPPVEMQIPKTTSFPIQNTPIPVNLLGHISTKPDDFQFNAL